MNTFTIRAMINKDWPEVRSIYKSGISTGIATFETSLPTLKEWNKAHLPFGRIVAISNNQIVGWAALSPISKREVYKGVAEVSIYIDSTFQRIGIGKELLTQLISIGKKEGIWTMQANIFPENIGSLKLHESLGFRKVGYREKIAQRNGVWFDNILLELRAPF